MQDRYLKLVLTVMAVALSVIAMAQLDAPADASATTPREKERLAAPSPGRPAAGFRSARGVVKEPAGRASGAPQSTLALRWRIPYATHVNAATAGLMDCATAVSVVGFGPDPISVEVEFFDTAGNPEGVSSFTVDTPGEPDMHVTDDDVDVDPFYITSIADTGIFAGYALVSADDPRIFVGAYLVCHEEGGSGDFPATVTNVGAFPVGPTATFFQAGTPGASTTPGSVDAAS